MWEGTTDYFGLANHENRVQSNISNLIHQLLKSTLQNNNV